MQTILTIDDELSVRESYRMLLGDSYRILVAEHGKEGLALLEKKYVDLILLDLTMPGMSGMEVLKALRERGDTTPVIVVTGSNTVESAVLAMKEGAHDFVMKPFDIEELQGLIARTLEALCGQRELDVLRAQTTSGFENIIGDSPALREVLERAHQAMQVDSTVLINGETGTGKDVLARAIHHGGVRKDKPYVPLSCCAIPEALFESELFGHEKGAFTGATDTRMGKLQIANGGTVFLDEIGEMPLEAQAKLLRVLQDSRFFSVGGTKETEVDVRFICATNRDFQEAISEGRFREDLYYRINVVPLTVPPLRKRREDIPKLVAHFVAKHGARVNAQVQDFAPRSMAALSAYDWPGNIRELENTVERILVCNREATVIQPDMLDGMLPHQPGSDTSGGEGMADFEGLPLQEATERLERQLILRALEDTNQVQSQAAERLGTTRRILKYKMDQLGLSPDDSQSAAS